MEAENQNLAIESVHLHHGYGDSLPIFAIGAAVEGSWLVIGDFKGHGPVVVVLAFEEFVKTRHGSFASLVDDQIASDGEEPCVKTRLTIELSTPDHDPHPDLLEEILSHLAVAGQIEEIAQEPMLEADDQLVEQACVLALEARCNGEALLPHGVVRNGGGGLREKGAN